jgi:hypothetical protein
MNTSFQHLIPKDFNNDSRVWIYQANRPFRTKEVEKIQDELREFASQWLSHGVPVKGFATVLFDQFVVFIADETATGVGGCSTDSSVRVVKNIEKEFAVSLFDRQILAFIVKDNIRLIPLSKVNECLEEKIISAETLYFNNTILTKQELLDSWVIPISKSWLARRIEAIYKSVH